MPYGYMGKVLWVDLSKGDIKEKVIPEEYYRKFLTGYGLAAKILFDEMKPGVDPLGPENILAVMSGILTGTGSRFSGRWMVASKSPLTGTWGDANCGGSFAPAIKLSGYDGFFFTGKSPNPVYLLIDGDKIELVDAKNLWGEDTEDTEKKLKAKHGDNFRIACIGKGGENLALIAGVVTDGGRLAARGGLGAVMGSKNLKAICLNGDESRKKEKIKVYDRPKLDDITNKFSSAFKETINIEKCSMEQIGTPAITGLSDWDGDSPVKNWSGTGTWDFPFGGWELAGKCWIHQKERFHCSECLLGCGGYCSVEEGLYKLKKTHKPEYETLCAFGTMLLNDDIHSIFKANDLCNRGGIDTISCGAIIAWAYEAFEKGVITKKDTDNLELRWGDSQSIVPLVQKIIDGEGIGRYLKDGVKRAADHFNGGREYAIHCGGQELPMHDPRQVGWGIINFERIVSLKRMTDCTDLKNINLKISPKDLKDYLSDLSEHVSHPDYSSGLSLGVAYEVEPTPGRHTSCLVGCCDPYWTKTEGSNLVSQRNKKLHPLKVMRSRMKPDDGHITDELIINIANGSRFACFINGLGMCAFAFGIGPTPPIVEWTNAATGWDYTFEDYIKIGERIETLRHAFNLREGITGFEMTARARGVPPLEGIPPICPNANNTPDFDRAKVEYYKKMRWDPETAKPLPEALDDLGLPEVKRALYPAEHGFSANETT
jgi:aldehyde:ferredoxin oxidoreductase